MKEGTCCFHIYARLVKAGIGPLSVPRPVFETLDASWYSREFLYFFVPSAFLWALHICRISYVV
jgi:hypothetical protein